MSDNKKGLKETCRRVGRNVTRMILDIAPKIYYAMDWGAVNDALKKLKPKAKTKH